MCVDDVQIFASHPTLRTSRNPLAGWRALFNRGVGFGGHNPLGLFLLVRPNGLLNDGFSLRYLVLS